MALRAGFIAAPLGGGTTMKRSHTLVRSWLIAATALAMLGVSFVASAEPVPQTENGVSYVSGGIGKGPQQAMQAMRKNYNLFATFAQKGTGAYLSDVKMDIRDSTGKEVVTAISEGPFFFAKLPSGKYSVSATYLGSTQARPVDIEGGKKVSVYLYWINE